ncbi:MAG TPA: hypothetical protein VFX85_08140 [Solirubrobacterales bacterium]|nr:hypothetical protein [Solirubrobacterales bacterium]
MEDLGEPSSYLAVNKGVPVYSSDGQKLGRVVRVMAAPEADMFDGIVFDTTAGPGGHRFVDAPEVGQIYERGVVLKIDAAAAANLQPPTANPGALKVNPADLAGGKRSSLGRMWDRLSGKG